MAVIAWGPMLETGHAVVDGQHRRLVDLVNELHDAMRARAAADVIGRVIKELTRYTEYHFSTEEKLMASYGYSATTEHVAEHQAFVEKVGEFARKYDEGNAALSIEVIDFLREWLTAHILRSDKVMVKELLAKGAA